MEQNSNEIEDKAITFKNNLKKYYLNHITLSNNLLLSFHLLLLS